MTQVAYVSSIHMRPIRDPDGEPRLRPYTSAEVDAWAEEVVSVAAEKWSMEHELPPMLLFLFPPRNDERRTVQGMINISPFMKTGRISEMAEALPRTLRGLRAFAMLRIEWIFEGAARDERAMRVTFETFQRAWTRTYLLSNDFPHAKLLSSEDGSKHKDPRFERWLRNDQIN